MTVEEILEEWLMFEDGEGNLRIMGRTMTDEEIKMVEEKEGEVLAEVRRRDEYIRAWRVTLSSVEIDRKIERLGYSLRSNLLEALGEEFTLDEAKKFIEAGKDPYAERMKAKIAEVTERAKRTGEDQFLREITAACSDPGEDCDLDIIVEYITPDGKTKEERYHTYWR